MRRFRWLSTISLVDALAALAIGCFVSTTTLASPVFLVGAVACVLHWTFFDWRSVSMLVWVACGVILSSSILAVTLAPTYFGLQGPAILVAVWTALVFPLALTSHSTKTFDYLVPFWALHAVLVIGEGAHHVSTDYWWPAQGIADSRSVVAGFLMFGALYSAYRHRIVPLALCWAALLFTGSRMGVGTALLLLSLMVVKGQVGWKPLVCMVATTVVAVFLSYDYIPAMFRLVGTESGIADKVGSDAMGRLRLHTVPLPWPQGPIGATEDTHNVAMRWAIELGLPAAVAWVSVSLYALWRRPRYDLSWWFLAGFLLLTLVDYYPMMPLVISAMWWVLIGMRTVGKAGKGTLWYHGENSGGDQWFQGQPKQ